MRLLIIGINYLPEKTGIGPYTAALAEHLAAKGHQVEVLTGLPSYPEWTVHPEYRFTIIKSEVIGQVTVHRRWHYVPHVQSVFRRLLYEVSFLMSGCSALLLKRPDLVLGVTPALSGGILARLAGKRFGVPYALLVQDLLGLATTQSGVSRWGGVASAVTVTERWVAQGAASIGVIAEGFRPYLEISSVPAERVHRVRNWSRLASCSESGAETRRRLGWHLDEFVCLHAGNMGHKQGLENVLECARLAQESHSDIRFVLMGDGNRRSGLQMLANEHALRNVDFLPLQSDEEVPNILGAADVLLINQRADVREMALPSKLTSYMASARPVLAAVNCDSETAKELRTTGAGFVIPPEDPAKLLEAILGLRANPQMQQVLAEKGRKYALNVLTPEAALLNLEVFLLRSREEHAAID